MAVTHKQFVCCVFLLFLTPLAGYTVSYSSCGTKWTQLNGVSYCTGSSNLTYIESRAFCQEYSADLLVLDSELRYLDLRALLNATSAEHDDAIIDFFIGVYQRKCSENTDPDCTWLEPYSGKWFWIDNDTPITNSSDTYWQILDTFAPHISGFNVVTAVDSNKQHFVVGSDGNVLAVDGFDAEGPHLVRLLPLCARRMKPETTLNQLAASIATQNCLHYILFMFILSYVIYAN